MDLTPKYRRVAADAARLYREGQSIAEVGRRLDVYPAVIKQALRFMSVPLRPRWGQTPLRDALAGQIRVRYQRGDQTRRIAAELSVSRQTVENIIGELGLPRRHSAERRQARTEQIAERHRQGDPVAAIAAELSISEWTVYNTLRQHGKLEQGRPKG